MCHSARVRDSSGFIHVWIRIMYPWFTVLLRIGTGGADQQRNGTDQEGVCVHVGECEIRAKDKRRWEGE